MGWQFGALSRRLANPIRSSTMPLESYYSPRKLLWVCVRQKGLRGILAHRLRQQAAGIHVFLRSNMAFAWVARFRKAILVDDAEVMVTLINDGRVPLDLRPFFGDYKNDEPTDLRLRVCDVEDACVSVHGFVQLCGGRACRRALTSLPGYSPRKWRQHFAPGTRVRRLVDAQSACPEDHSRAVQPDKEARDLLLQHGTVTESEGGVVRVRWDGEAEERLHRQSPATEDDGDLFELEMLPWECVRERHRLWTIAMFWLGQAMKTAYSPGARGRLADKASFENDFPQ